jgi:UDP-GlcNAc:undecaprenyl-phosphate/decaprenyl-phosphate GlcNAc-1-phosphate transferase
MFVTAAFFTAFFVTLFSIPSIVKVAAMKNLYDLPGDRKTHHGAIPTLGGVGIFAGMLFAITFWANQQDLVELQYIIASFLLLFFMGVKDDIVDLVAWKKLLGQLIAALIVAHYADIRVYNMFGLFGVNDVPLWFSYVLTIFTIVVVTNSFNLIDGIDTLAASLGLIASLTFGAWFLAFQATEFAICAFALSGSLLAFLYFNKTPAKIFMGDTGALIVGFTCSILAIQFIEINRHLPVDHPYKILSVPIVAISIMVIPLFDTFRVFFLRVLRGRPPFSSDRQHVHHRLVDLGLSHVTASLILSLVTLFFIVTIYFLQSFSWIIMLAYLLIGLGILDMVLRWFTNRQKGRTT